MWDLLKWDKKWLMIVLCIMFCVPLPRQLNEGYCLGYVKEYLYKKKTII